MKKWMNLKLYSFLLLVFDGFKQAECAGKKKKNFWLLMEKISMMNDVTELLPWEQIELWYRLKSFFFTLFIVLTVWGWVFYSFKSNRFSWFGKRVLKLYKIFLSWIGIKILDFIILKKSSSTFYFNSSVNPN